MKIHKILKITALIILGAGIGAAVFSFVVAQKLYFPNIKQVAQDTGAGLNLNAYQYSPWLWNKEKITVVNIYDQKNDAPNVQYKLEGEIYSVRLIHSGEDYAMVVYSDPDFSSIERAFVVHRSPKAEGDNTIEQIYQGGNIIAVAPDESGFFYISGSGAIFKSGWDRKILMKNDLGMSIMPITESQLIGMGSRTAYQPVKFFSNNTKMAFNGTPVGERDGFLFIWDLGANNLQKIDVRELYPNYPPMSLMVQDDKLYLERTDVKISRQLLAQ